MTGRTEPLLTLEPLVEAVRSGVEEAGWTLSGLQKTTSHQFEGKWAGDSTRSAYLFFHRPDGPEWASVDVFLDETSRGLTGNLALVVEARRLGELGSVPRALEALAALSATALPKGVRTPLTLRLHLASTNVAVDRATAEIRFKLRIPAEAVNAGAAAVSTLAADTAARFDILAQADALRPFLE